jgi:hypothetical protein
VERAKSQIRTLTRYRPSSSEGQRHNDWFTNAHSGSDSVTASTDPERYRPLPSLAVPYPTAPGPNFHHLWWASRPMVTPLKTLFQIIDSTRSACGAGTLACWVETHLDRTSSGLKAPTRVSAQQTESPRHLASSSTLVGRRPMVTPLRSRLGLSVGTGLGKLSGGFC